MIHFLRIDPSGDWVACESPDSYDNRVKESGMKLSRSVAEISMSPCVTRFRIRRKVASSAGAYA
jgi:hypothetical protein